MAVGQAEEVAVVADEAAGAGELEVGERGVAYEIRLI